MDKNFVVTICDLDMTGKGIAHQDGKTIFVDNSLVGEKIECRPVQEKNNIVFAKNVKILSQSKARQTPLCPYFFECGGCDLQHINYDSTLKMKKEQIKLAFKKIANIDAGDFEIVESENKYFYRNKISMKICQINEQKCLCYYKKNSHEPVKIESCKICNKNFDFVIECVNDYLASSSLEVFDEKTKKGILKHLVARIVNESLLVTFVLNENKKLENVEKLYESLKSRFENVGINKNINKGENEILSPFFEDVIGKNNIKFENFGVVQNITNASFLQVNTPVANKIYEYVLSKLSGNVVNCYSGAGLLSALIAKNNKASKIFGIEINKHASLLADRLKEENKIFNLKNLCGDSAKVLEKLCLENFCLVVDPPKSGIDNNMIECIKKFLPNKIVYISCNKTSLAKNLKSLNELYLIESVKAFDMFPQTKDVETVVVLNKK